MNDTLKNIKDRRSVRNYTDTKIPDHVLKELIDCARFAPTARNTQPWEFIIITEQDTLKQISTHATFGSFIKNAKAAIIVCSKDYDYFLEDSSAATENILIAAQSLGIGSCWVAGHSKEYVKEIKKILNIPEELHLVSIIALGHPDEKEKSKINKRTLDDILHWQTY